MIQLQKTTLVLHPTTKGVQTQGVTNMKVQIPTILLTSMLFTTTACANTQRFTHRAPVVSVEPIVQTTTEKVPHESCWNESVRSPSRHSHKATAPTVIGAIIGGVAGGAIGRNNRNQEIIAGAGAALGAALAHDASRRDKAHWRHTTQRRCEVNYEYREHETITGYRVGYRFGDDVYYTRTRHEPGNTINLRVALEPAGRYD